MSTPYLIWMIVMGLMFLLWMVLMFRMLWQLTKRSAAKLEETGGGYFTWLGHSLSTFGAFFTSDENKTERRRLIALTVLLFVTITIAPLLLIPGP